MLAASTRRGHTMHATNAGGAPPVMRYTLTTQPSHTSAWLPQALAPTLAPATAVRATSRMLPSAASAHSRPSRRASCSGCGSAAAGVWPSAARCRRSSGAHSAA